MCGRFALYTTDKLEQRYDLKYSLSDLKPNYNASPGQYLPVIINTGSGNQASLMNWGLVPSWAKDPKIGSRLINARAESILVKPTFRHAFARRRCLVPINGFYEWSKTAGRKQPYFFKFHHDDIYSLAGLWENWMDQFGSEMQSFTIITTRPNQKVSPVHDRMPVVIHPDEEVRWLDPKVNEINSSKLLPLLQPYPPEEIVRYPVAAFVNQPGANSPILIEPLIQT